MEASNSTKQPLAGGARDFPQGAMVTYETYGRLIGTDERAAFEAQIAALRQQLFAKTGPADCTAALAAVEAAHRAALANAVAAAEARARTACDVVQSTNNQLQATNNQLQKQNGQLVADLAEARRELGLARTEIAKVISERDIAQTQFGKVAPATGGAADRPPPGVEVMYFHRGAMVVKRSHDARTAGLAARHFVAGREGERSVDVPSRTVTYRVPDQHTAMLVRFPFTSQPAFARNVSALDRTLGLRA